MFNTVPLINSRKIKKDKKKKRRKMLLKENFVINIEKLWNQQIREVQNLLADSTNYSAQTEKTVNIVMLKIFSLQQILFIQVYS